MVTLENLEQKIWWSYIGEDLQKLFVTSEFLVKTMESWGSDLPGGENKFDDYAFVVFPAAKAFEGFLKKMFFELEFITENDYFGKKFRIGRSLNPSLPKQFRRDEVYAKIVKFCGGSKLADNLWETWKTTRNLTFHWFPNEKNAITLMEAKERVDMIVRAIDESFEACRLDYSRNKNYDLETVT